MSFAKQLPPQPRPGLRNFDPIRESMPMPDITSVASAPTRSQMLAISLANPIFIARNALAAYLIISAEVSEVASSGTDTIDDGRATHGGGVKLCATIGSYNSRITLSVAASPPTTMRSGYSE